MSVFQNSQELLFSSAKLVSENRKTMSKGSFRIQTITQFRNKIAKNIDRKLTVAPLKASHRKQKKISML